MTKKSITIGLITVLIAMLMAAALGSRSNEESNEAQYPVSAGATLLEFRNVHEFDSEVISWGIRRVGADQVSQAGRGVKVAILDTGIDLDHIDILVSGNVTFVEGTDSGDDDNGHGTQVAGIVAARLNSIGVVGIAPDVDLYAVKVLNSEGQGSWEAVQKGIDWAITNQMQVINMSFGSTLDWPKSVQTELERAYEAGIVLVAGAGNAGNPSGEGDTLLAPGRYPEVISVGAIDHTDKRLTTSGTGGNLELVAPGESIPTTFNNGGYGYVAGTSAASPHVTGVAALLLGAGVSTGEVRQILCQTAQTLSPTIWDSRYGYGVVNAPKALAASQKESGSAGDWQPDY